MRALWRRFKNGYLNLNLQTKFTIALISIVVIPACLTAFLFYGRLYSMVVSNTIRQEQDASAKTAPLIERTMDTILATTRNITGQNFFHGTFFICRSAIQQNSLQHLTMPLILKCRSASDHRFHCYRCTDLCGFS